MNEPLLCSFLQCLEFSDSISAMTPQVFTWSLGIVGLGPKERSCIKILTILLHLSDCSDFECQRWLPCSLQHLCSLIYHLMISKGISYCHKFYNFNPEFVYAEELILIIYSLVWAKGYYHRLTITLGMVQLVTHDAERIGH